MSKMGEFQLAILERINDAPTIAALATLRLQLSQSERMTPEFDAEITRRMEFLQAEASRN
jgi:hypothetical protein